MNERNLVSRDAALCSHARNWMSMRHNIESKLPTHSDLGILRQELRDAVQVVLCPLLHAEIFQVRIAEPVFLRESLYSQGNPCKLLFA